MRSSSKHFPSLFFIIALGCSTGSSSNPSSSSAPPPNSVNEASGGESSVLPIENNTAGNNHDVVVGNEAGNNSSSGGIIDDGGGTTSEGGTTTDSPTAGGSTGTTSDGVGSTSGTAGSTDDGMGGTAGNTDDGTGGVGNTDDGTGGVGNTDDNTGGVGNTDDNTGGVGNTDDNTGGMGGSVDGPPPCFPTFMDTVNALVFEDATLSGADTEGRLLVGGDANLSWTVGAALERDCSRYDLIVGGDLVWTSGSAQNGMVAVGGEMTRSTGVGIACGFVQNEDAFDFDTAESELLQYSDHLTYLTVNGTVSTNYGQLILTGIDPEVNVFEVNSADFTNISSMEIDVPEGSAVIINVSGTDISLANFGFGSIGSCKGGGDQCHMIIWNMYEAETVTISGVGLQGTLLAPLATVDFSNGMIDGQLIVRNLIGSGEHHPYMFTGCYELTL